MAQPSFEKRQRERARRERTAAKAAKREERKSTRDTDTDKPDGEPAADEGAIIAALAALHAKFDAGEIEFDDFLAAKDELTARLI